MREVKNRDLSFGGDVQLRGGGGSQSKGKRRALTQSFFGWQPYMALKRQVTY